MRGVVIVYVGLVLSGAVLCQGCGTSVETGRNIRARYVWDTLHARLRYPIDDVYHAASDAVRQLDLDVVASDHDGVAGVISTLDAQRDYITIDLESMPRARTLLRIRAGVFGDRNKSEVIFERIVENLGEEVAAARRPG
jgi:hypothetical protein